MLALRLRSLLMITVILFGLSGGYRLPASAEAQSSFPANTPAAIEIPALYVVFERSAQQNARPVFAREVEISTLAGEFPGDLDSATLNLALQADDGIETPVAVTLSDAAGQPVFQTVAFAPNWLRAEFHGEQAADPIDGQWIPLETSAFAVRLPLLSGAQVSLAGADGTSLGAFMLDELDSISPSSSSISSSAGPVFTQVAATGTPANRVDLLILGDGYTTAQQTEFNADVQTTLDAFFAIDPLADYRNFFNVATLFTASAQSGADQPPYDPACTDQGTPGDPATCCPEPGGTGSGNVSTAFDATFCSYYVQRLLTVNYSKVLQAASANPDYDHILVIVNDDTYGGSGGQFAVTSMNSLAPQIAQHEFGHSFIGLADEYDTPLPNWIPCSDVGVHPTCAANVTDVTSRDLVKWRPWIEDTTPIPTDENNPAYAAVVGLFEGAYYQETGFYRPGQNCIMRSLGRPFCQVPSQEFVLTLYRGGWGVPATGIRLIEPGSASPLNTTPINLTHPAQQTFQAAVLQPQGGTIEITWLVDGQVVAAGASSYQYRSEAAKPGAHEIRLRVKDTSGYIHPEMGGTVDQAELAWTVNVSVPNIVISLAGTPTTPLVADGISTATLTAQATLNSNPVQGEIIQFSSPIGTLSQASVETDAQGKAQVTLTSTQSGEAVVSATNGVSAAQFTITFIPGPPAAIVGWPERAVMGAGIEDHGFVYGRVQDQFANPISGITLTFTTTLGTLSDLSAVSGVDGNAGVILYAPETPGTATLQVSGATFTDTFMVDFIYLTRVFLPVMKK